MAPRLLPALLAALAVAACARLEKSPAEPAAASPSWPAADATISAEPAKPSFRPGERVVVRVRVTNNGQIPFSCLMPCGDLEPRATRTDPAGATRELSPTSAPVEAQEAVYWKPLSYQEHADHDIDVGDRYDVSEPGRYSFRVAAKGRQGWIDRLSPRVARLETALEFEVAASTAP